MATTDVEIFGGLIVWMTFWGALYALFSLVCPSNRGAMRSVVAGVAILGAVAGPLLFLAFPTPMDVDHAKVWLAKLAVVAFLAGLLVAAVVAALLQRLGIPMATTLGLYFLLVTAVLFERCSNADLGNESAVRVAAWSSMTVGLALIAWEVLRRRSQWRGPPSGGDSSRAVSGRTH